MREIRKVKKKYKKKGRDTIEARKKHRTNKTKGETEKWRGRELSVK